MGLFRKSSNSENSLKGFLAEKDYIDIRNTLDNDLFIIGFPKSGNTWMQHMITGVLYGADMSKIQNNLVRELTPDEQQIKFYKRYNEVMAFKSHHLPSDRYKRVIYLVRDGRDAYTSFFHMETGRKRQVTFDEIVREHVGLECSWATHVRSWMANPFNAEILFVRYEDLLSNTVKELQRIVAFVKSDISNELLFEITTNCSFESMRAKEETKYWEKSKEWASGEYFVRKGEKGDYVNLFTPELHDFFLEESSDVMKQFDYL